VPPRKRSRKPSEVFAENLKQVRRERGISQMDLGLAVGLHPTAVARLETGQRDPRLATIAKLAQGLGVPAGDLVRGI
jgi:transcriptional regulator with XRE-family HTH domain